MELCSMSCCSLDERGVWGRIVHVFTWLSPFIIHLKLKRCWDSWPLEKKNSIQGQRLDLSELLCNRVLLKYKRDRENF